VTRSARAVALAAAVTLAASCWPRDDDALLTASWATFRRAFITDEGRVVRPEHGGDTVSEGQAYALLRAAWMNDRPTFDRVWQWTRSHLQRRGQRWPALLAWTWSPGSGVTDWNVASDADADVALALLVAAGKWSSPDESYRIAALAMLTDLVEHSAAVDEGGMKVFLPGAWADQRAVDGVVLLNPSYFAPASFRAFHQATGDRRWLELADSSYAVLQAVCRARPALPPDWVRWSSIEQWEPDAGARGRAGWDAVRVPWRIATDALWWQEPRAEEYLTRCIEPLVRSQLEGGLAVEYDELGRPRGPADHPLANALSAFGLSQSTDRDRLLARVQHQVTRQGSDVYFGEPDRYYVNSLAWLPFLLRAGRYTRP
jgi:endoglucanase